MSGQPPRLNYSTKLDQMFRGYWMDGEMVLGPIKMEWSSTLGTSWGKGVFKKIIWETCDIPNLWTKLDLTLRGRWSCNTDWASQGAFSCTFVCHLTSTPNWTNFSGAVVWVKEFFFFAVKNWVPHIWGIFKINLGNQSSQTPGSNQATLSGISGCMLQMVSGQ